MKGLKVIIYANIQRTFSSRQTAKALWEKILWRPFGDYAAFSFAADKLLPEQHSYNLEDCIYFCGLFRWPGALLVYAIRRLGYTDSGGYSGVASIDNNSGQITKTRLRKNNSPDDHNAVAVDVLMDGRIIIAVSGGHNKTSKMFIRISSKTENVEQFDDPIVIEAGKVTTYAQLLQKNGKIWLFFRTGREEESSWSYSSSENGLTWSAPVGDCIRWHAVLSESDGYNRQQPVSLGDIFQSQCQRYQYSAGFL